MCICFCRVVPGISLLVYVHISRLIHLRVIYATPLLDLTTLMQYSRSTAGLSIMNLLDIQFPPAPITNSALGSNNLNVLSSNIQNLQI